MTTMPMTEGFNPMAIANYGGMQSPYNPGTILPTGSGIGSITPAGGGLGGMFAGSGLGANMPTFSLALGGLQTIGGLWAAFNAAKVAKQQLNFTKSMANANLANQTQSYNTAIEDRARSRGFTEGQSSSQVDDYISRNSLAKRTVG